MFFQSVRFKLILWYMLFLTVTLFAFGTLLYGNFRTNLYGDLDDLLSSRAEGVTNSIITYWQILRVEAAEEGVAAGPSSVADMEHMGRFLAISRAWVEEKRKDPELMSLFVQILNAKGECLVASKNMPLLKPFPAEDFQDILKGEDSFDTVRGETADGKKLKFRLYSKPVMEKGTAVYVVQVAGPSALVSLALNNLVFILFVLIPLTVILAGIPGVLLARLMLRPVDTMIATLRQITAENLKLKIHIPDTRDELRRLADAFNEMIERLDRSFSSQQEFIQDISHELKTPLTVLRGELEVALKKARSPEEYETVLRSSLEEVGRVSGVVENLLLLAHFDSNQVTLEIKKTDLSGLAEAAVADMKVLADQKDIAVSYSGRKGIIMDGDEAQMRRLIVNLIDNAIKYTHRRGEVSVETMADAGHAILTVRDTGVGIPDDELPYIFDRFYQVSRRRTSTSGFGLGLSIVKSVVEAHHGTVKVESMPGQGTVFTVSLSLLYPG